MSIRAFIVLLLAATAVGLYASGVLDAAGGRPGRGIYVAQAGGGNQSGRGSCANAHPLSWLDSSSSWGAGNPIAPGATVTLCGTITGYVHTFTSGSSGEPITILFNTGAKIADKQCPSSGCVNIAEGSEYITIDGGANGAIENTENDVPEHPTQEPIPATTGILANACKHCSFENLTIANLFVAKRGANEYNNTEVRGIYMRAERGNLNYDRIENDVFHDMGWAVSTEANTDSGHINVEHDTFYHLTHGFTPGAGNFNGGNIGPVVFAHNHFYGDLNWEDGAADTNHVDGVHCFSAVGMHAHYSGLYIYDNYITTEGQNVTSPIFLEGNSGSGATPCGDSTSNIWVFNNVLVDVNMPEGSNGLLAAESGEPHLYNNTLIGNSTTERTCEILNSVAAKVRFKNNLTTTCKVLVEAEKARFAAGGMQYNLWADAGATDEAFICANPARHAYGFAELKHWQACMANDAHAVTASEARLDSREMVGAQGRPEPDSPALGAGTNLSRLCTKETVELCKNIRGEARSTSGAWNIGAY